MGPLPQKGNMKQKITDYLDEIYGGTFTATHLQKLVTRLESAKRLITLRHKKHWDESDVVLITYADQFHSNDLKPLPTFNQFYPQWLQSIFSHVHLLPFYPWSSDDGFSVIDYHQVASEAGEWQDIQQLGECSHLMFDFVCNHMSAKSEWFKNYLQQQPGFEDFFIAVDPQTDLSAVTRPRALPLLTPFQMRDHSTRHLWTTFSDDQIDLNYRSPEVLLAMVDVLLCYLEKGAEYVRLDAVGFMWKEPGTSCIHLEKTHLIIKLLRSIIDNVAPGTVIITETNVPHKDNIAYFGEGDDEAHMVYQFSLPPLVLHAVQKQNVEALCAWAQNLTLPSSNTTWFNFLASHDGIGLNPLRGLLPESEILALAEVGGKGIVVPAAWGMFTFRLPPMTSPRSLDGDRKMVSDSLRVLEQVAARTGTVVYLEPLNRYQDHMINTLADARRYIVENDLKHVQIIGDFYHMNIEEDNLAQALHDNRDLLGHVHIADNHRYQPGSGTLDFHALFEQLRADNYQGYVVYEGRIRAEDPAQAYRDSLAWLRTC